MQDSVLGYPCPSLDSPGGYGSVLFFEQDTGGTGPEFHAVNSADTLSQIHRIPDGR